MQVTLLNTKGGVGKTTASVFIATAFAAIGRTVLVDTDPDASAQSWAAAAERRGEDLGFTVIGLTKGVRGGVRRVRQEGGYEHVVIDTPPGYGDRELARAALEDTDAGVIPLSPRLMDADRLHATFDLMRQATEVNEQLSPFVLVNQVRAGTQMSMVVREFLDRREFPVLPTVGLRERYATAFGHRIEDLGEWQVVVDELRKAVTA